MITDSQRMMMVAAARNCLGTPFHHQGRTPMAGLDCIGLVIVALRAIGWPITDCQDYAVRPDGKSLLAALEAHGGIATSWPRAGDILLFRYDDQPQHVAMQTDEGHMIHAFAPARGVVETSIDTYWRRRLIGIYEMRSRPSPHIT
jgi:cell wall-associated NlpC family hydrolase